MKVSYAITVANEEKEFKNLMNSLLSWKDKDDEIVVLVDNGKVCLVEDLKQYIWDLGCSETNVTVKWSIFEGDFAEWKNMLNRTCTGDWIFQIDADEMPSEALIKNLHQILDNTVAECIAIPRTNIVEGITPEDIAKWHWRETEHGINWPDYQWRLYKNIPDRIRWEGKVHERPVGFKTYSTISDNQEIYKLDHFKDIERQRQQNAYYETIRR